MVYGTRWLGIAVVSLSLVGTLPGPAIAQCAWVVWRYVVPSGLWAPVKGSSSESACQQVVDDLQERDLKRYPLTSNGGSIFACLPDTIDPRAPKTK
jgi:hypothetical protein